MKNSHKGIALLLRHLINVVLSVIFLLQNLSLEALAQTDPNLTLPQPNQMISLSQSFKPVSLVGLKLDPKDALHFDFIVDKGQESLSEELFKSETLRLVRYFLSSMTTPKDDLWVNLSPYEGKSIIPESFGTMEMGRDLLAQDYLLKQITSSMIYPEGDLGKEFWKKIYQKAFETYGTTDIPINTFNKVWIVPQKADLLETNGAVIITQSRLKVMLEQDYVALNKNIKSAESPKGITTEEIATSPSAPPTRGPNDRNDTSTLGSQMVREMILPILEKEINEGKNFERLRQIYNALILATWYKKKVYDGLLAKAYMDQNKIGGTSIRDNGSSEVDVTRIYKQYLTAFKKGVYNYIKEDIDVNTGNVTARKYFSGGFFFGDVALNVSTAADNSIIAKLKAKYLPVMVAVVIQVLGLNASAQETPAVNPTNDDSTRIVSLLSVVDNKDIPIVEQTNAVKEAGVLVLKSQFGTQVPSGITLRELAEQLFPRFINLLKRYPNYEFRTAAGGKYTASFVAGYLEKHVPEVNPSNTAAMFKAILEMKELGQQRISWFIKALEGAQPTNPSVIKKFAELIQEHRPEIFSNTYDLKTILEELRQNKSLKELFDYKLDRENGFLSISIMNGNDNDLTTVSLGKFNSIPPESLSFSKALEMAVLSLIGLAQLKLWNDSRKETKRLFKEVDRSNKESSTAEGPITRVPLRKYKMATQISQFQDSWATSGLDDTREQWRIEAESETTETKELVKQLNRSRLKEVDPKVKGELKAQMQELQILSDALEALWHPIDDERIDRYLVSKGKKPTPSLSKQFTPESIQTARAAARNELLKYDQKSFKKGIDKLYGELSDLSYTLNKTLDNLRTGDDITDDLKKLNSDTLYYLRMRKEVDVLQEKAKIMGQEFGGYYGSFNIEGKLNDVSRQLEYNREALKNSQINFVFAKRFLNILGESILGVFSGRIFSEIKEASNRLPGDSVGGIDLTQDIPMNIDQPHGQDQWQMDTVQIGSAVINGVKPQILSVQDIDLNVFLKPN